MTLAKPFLLRNIWESTAPVCYVFGASSIGIDAIHFIKCKLITTVLQKFGRRFALLGADEKVLQFLKLHPWQKDYLEIRPHSLILLELPD